MNNKNIKTMKRISFTIITAAAVILCASCEKQEQEFSVTEGQTVSLTLEATRGNADMTRTEFRYNEEYASLESVWSLGDVIYVYSLKSGQEIGQLYQNGDITNLRSNSSSQYATSYTTFNGKIELKGDDAITDNFAFVYQGAGRKATAVDGKLTYEMGVVNKVESLCSWDIAYATGRIQGTVDNAACAVSFTNKLAFGFFTTENLKEEYLKANYYNSFTLDVKTGNIVGTMGEVDIPVNTNFFMPLIPGTVDIDCAYKNWMQDPSNETDKYGYIEVKQSIPFVAAAGCYYRLGRGASFGPVPFEYSEWTLWETLRDSRFVVAEGHEVGFTQGNLQFIGSSKNPYWRTAIDQYTFLGYSNGVSPSEKTSILETNTDVDLFEWHIASYASTILEKGSLYAEAGMECPERGPIYSLTRDDLYALFSYQWWGFATVTLKDGKTTCSGVVVCPKTFDEESARRCLTGAVYHTNEPLNHVNSFTENNISQETIDCNGLLFLPAAGYRNGTDICGVGTASNYWTVTPYESGNGAYCMNVKNTGYFSVLGVKDPNFGFAVRLAYIAN